MQDIDQDNYDSLLSYEGGDAFFETVLGGLANVHCDSDDEISSISSGSSSSSQSSTESSPYVTGGDKRSYVFEDAQSSINFDNAEVDNDMPEDELIGGDEDVSEFITENIPDVEFQSQDFVINGGDKNSDVFEDEAYGGIILEQSDTEVSPLFNNAIDKEQIDSVKDNNVVETVTPKKKNKDIKNLIKNMIKSL